MAAKKIKKQVNKPGPKPSLETQVPIRMSIDEGLKESIQEEAATWHITLSDVFRNSALHVLSLSPKERREIFFPMPEHLK